MRYKLILIQNTSGGGNPDGMTAVSFYTRNQAVECAQSWVQENAACFARLWDGSSWTLYNPVP